MPAWAESASLFSITATATETSVVCAGRSVPTKVVAQRGRSPPSRSQDAARLRPRPASCVALLAPLAEEGISVFTVSTFDTDWILVPLDDADRAGRGVATTGHPSSAAVPVKPTRKEQANERHPPRAASAPPASPPG